MLIVACLGLGLGAAPAHGRPAVQVSIVPLVIPTYNYSAFLYPEHSKVYNMDYYKLDWGAYEASGPHPEPHEYTAVVVENAWLRLTFLPELGGRLYGITDVASGEELLYQNPVVKPTHWGPPEQGWWLAAGGIEWCLPVEEHGYEWGVPWDYSLSTTADGATVTLWDSTATDRVHVQVAVHLPAGQAAFTVTPRLENPTAAPVALKFWENAMLAPGAANTVGEELRFELPTAQVTVHSRGDGDLPGPGEPMSWPVYNGTDYARLGNWRQWLGAFIRPQAADDWTGVYDEGVLHGVARVFPHAAAQGVKLFGMGWQQPIDWHTWTDYPDATYVELHGGPAPTFADSITLPPGGALEWTETWLPLRDLPRLSYANADVALGVKQRDGGLDVGVLPAGAAGDLGVRLWRKDGCMLLWRQDGLALEAGEAYTHRLDGIGLPAEQVVLGVLDGGRVLGLSGRLDCPLPASVVDELADVQATPDFAISWSVDDPNGTAAGYDIQVRDGDAEAGWTDWLTGTAAGSALFSGEDGHTYTFRSRVRDVLGRVEAWPPGDWDDTATTVLLEPAPVLITSAKVAEPACAQAGDEVQFEIRLSNTGNLTADVELIDPLPAGLALEAGPWVSPTLLPPPYVVSGTIVWNGSLAPGGARATVGLTARVLEMPPGPGIVNVASIDDGVHPALYRAAAVRTCTRIYLPIVRKQG
jgi:uncharacterized repeat protein (TIGR01451 family)